MQINRQNLKWLGRMALILVLVSVADGLVGAFARKPLPWVAVIPALIPVLTAVFVIIPLMTEMKEEKAASPNA
jgi:heme A synthase